MEKQEQARAAREANCDCHHSDMMMIIMMVSGKVIPHASGNTLPHDTPHAPPSQFKNNIHLLHCQ
eukprot:6889367-Ditylum_brightwellii.AAC.1